LGVASGVEGSCHGTGAADHASQRRRWGLSPTIRSTLNADRQRKGISMNRIHTVLGSALLAGSFGIAVAADQAATPTNKADATKAMPAREDLKPGAAPTVERMDDNAQRQHGRSGAAGGSAAAQGGAAGGKPMASGTAQVASGVRDWKAIDTNNDNLIQPEEMEAALKEVGPQAKK
jgi:hypothetical protein